MTLANALRRLNSPAVSGRRKPPRLLLVTDARRLPDPRRIMARLPAGAGVVIRHTDAQARQVMARAALPVARRHRLALLISEDWRFAARLRGAGVHLPEQLGRSGRLAPILGWAKRARRIVTMACHSRAALARAAEGGVDAAIVSPVFPTNSHPGAKTLGGGRFRQWAAGSKIPVIALGGVNRCSARRLAGSRAYGLAAIDGWA